MLLAYLLFSSKKDGFDSYVTDFLIQKVISLWILLEINFLISKWELDSQEKANANILLQDKSSALFKIGAKDTNSCIQRRIYYGNYLNRCIEEFDRMKNLYLYDFFQYHN